MNTPTIAAVATADVQRRCPCCMSTVNSWKPIVYGPVGKSTLAQSRRGEVVLGGINHGRNEPRWQCGRCETRLGRPREELDRFGREVLDEGKPSPHFAVPTWRLMKTMRLQVIQEAQAA